MSRLPTNASWLDMLIDQEGSEENKPWIHCTPEEKVERWRNVLRVLLSLTPHERKHHFRMSRWGYTTPCGTVACVAGHCGMDPWFQARGFIMELEPFNPRRPREGAQPRFPRYRPSEFFGGQGEGWIFQAVSADFDEVVWRTKRYIQTLERHLGETVND